MTENTDGTRRRFLLGLGAAGAAALAGCSGDGDSGGDAATQTTVAETTTRTTMGGGMETTTRTTTTGEMETTTTGTAMLRVAHVSPNAPDVDVYADGSAVLEGVPFGAVSNYLAVPAGERQLRVTPAGDAGTTVFEGSVPVEAGGAYTVAAAGEVGGMADRSFSPIPLVDDTSDPGDDTARVRLTHVAPDAPAVDVTLAGSGDALFDGVAYGESGTVTVPAGDYTLEIRGDTEGDDGDIVAAFDVSLDGGASYTAFAAGYLTPGDDPGDTPFQLVVEPDAGVASATTTTATTTTATQTTMESSVPAAIDDYLAGANGYDGDIVDATGEDSVTVTLGADNAFAPAAVRIDAGTTINWEWEGGTHNVVSAAESAADFDSGDPTSDTDTTFSQSFDDPGVQLYYCEVHRDFGMLGAIDVV